MVDTKFPGGGNVVMTFANEQERGMAASMECGALSEVKTKVTKMFIPKIMMCHVSRRM